MKSEAEVRALLAEVRAERDQYIANLGSDSAYLDGKVKALEQVLGE